ncbi:hypothetical protein H2199_000130 [Coniosporium tulheliwenetii]|uniref:Uncharacterized protein n=1 Tax=Coniosporium tulheliwenetii TaxID=3383036 RepID=A0ACC2ZPA6_9PEZI|nr:hypothetical protein H2199_000130 [Cladosporium sp. JES 115]
MTYGNSNNKESFAARQRRAGLPRHNSHQQSAGNDYAYHAYMERHYALAMRKPLEGPPASQRTAEPRVRDSVIDFTQASHFMGQAPEHHPGAQSSEKPSGPRIRDSVLDFAQVNHFMGFAPGFTPAEEKSEDESLYSSTAPSGSSFAPGHPQRSLSPLARAVRPFDSTVKVAPNIRVSGIDSDFDEWGNRRCTQPAPGHEKAHPSRRPVPNVDPQGYSRSVPTGFSDIFSERELREAEERHRAKKEKGFFRSLFGGKKKK